MLWYFTIFPEVEFLFPGENGGELEVITFEEAKEKGAGEFCMRLLMCPKSATGGCLWISAHPATKGDIARRLGDGNDANLVPHTTLKVSMSISFIRFLVHSEVWFLPIYALICTGDRGFAQQGPCWTRGICPLLSSGTSLWPWCASLD